MAFRYADSITNGHCRYGLGSMSGLGSELGLGLGSELGLELESELGLGLGSELGLGLRLSTIAPFSDRVRQPILLNSIIVFLGWFFGYGLLNRILTLNEKFRLCNESIFGIRSWLDVKIIELNKNNEI